MSFGSNLENLRKQKGWSQDKLADKLHISRQAISKWENGTSKPDIDNVKSISNIFSIGIDELLDNELPDRAAKLDVEKEEKKENVIQVIKYMIIAVVLIYLISVIGKFISLLTIVNGIQKYANLDNYHYVITTYEDNERIEKVESWFKDGVSKTITVHYEESNILNTQEVFIDCKNKEVYIKDNNGRINLNYDEYIDNYNISLTGQLFSEIPLFVRKNDILYIFKEGLYALIQNNDENITLKLANEMIEIKKTSMLPMIYYNYNENSNIASIKLYTIDLNFAENINEKT